METLKIDRAFLREVPENREASAIVTAILRLARALGRIAVAEGVETEAQRRFLERAAVPAAPGLPARPADAGRRGRGADGRARRPRRPERAAIQACAVWRVTVRNGPRVEKLRAAALGGGARPGRARGARARGRPGPARRSTCARGRSRRSSRSRGGSSCAGRGRARRASTCAATARPRRGPGGSGAPWSSRRSARRPTTRCGASLGSEHQRRAVAAQPGGVRAPVGHARLQQRPEARRVVHHLEVADLVLDDVVEDLARARAAGAS